MSNTDIKVREKNYGIQKEGSTNKIADILREIEDILRIVCDKNDTVKEFSFWRLREGDCKEDVKKRTAEVQSIPDKKEDSKSAKLLKIVKKAEKLVYLFMLSFNPYYFTAEKFSISLDKIEDNQFKLSFKSPSKDYRKAVKQHFKLKDGG